MRRALVAFVIVVGCGGRAVQPTAVLSVATYSDHVAAAQEYERQAKEHEDAAAVAKGATPEWVCPMDSHLNAVSTEGGQQLVKREGGCHEVRGEDRSRHERAARRLRKLARAEYALAEALVREERTACESVRDQTRTPFADPAAVVSVAKVGDGSHVILRGELATVRAAIACFRARAATMGHDPAYMPYDPSVLHDTRVEIGGADGQVAVTIHGVNTAAVAAVWARAEALRSQR